MQTMFSDHKRIKWETNRRKISRKSPNTWKLTIILVNNLWDEGEVLKDIENILNKNKMKICHIKSVGCTWNSTLREIYSIRSVHEKIRKVSNKIHASLLMSQKKEQNKQKSTKDKKIMKIRQKSMKLKTHKENEKTESWFFRMINNIDKLLARLTKQREKTYKVSLLRMRPTCRSQNFRTHLEPFESFCCVVIFSINLGQPKNKKIRMRGVTLSHRR